MSVQGITVIVTLIFAGANCLENKMASSSVEEKQLVVEGMICGLSSDELKNLADHLEIPVIQYVGKSKLLISKLVRDKLYEEVGDRSTEADRLTFLGGIENFICGEPPSLEPVGKPKETNESPAQGKKNNSSYVDVDKVFRREFKIKGQIGAPGEENKLSFISLARQIESGLERCYPETEIIEAVIRAVGPGIALRSYLEATPGITLAKLRQILRSYFRENSATELFQQLATLTQSTSEDPQTFLMRALELRQKILFVSKESDTTVKYDKQLVQNLFLHSVETGLREDVVRVKIRPHLQINVSDEQLISELNKVAATEAERKTKFGNQKQRPQKAVYSQVTAPEDKSEKKSNKLVEQVAAMQAEISSLRETISSLAVQSARANPRPKPKLACPECQKSDMPGQCTHCFHCGSSEHFA